MYCFPIKLVINLKSYDVLVSQVGIAHCALECKPKVDWNKGNASLLILEKEFGPEWEKR